MKNAATTKINKEAKEEASKVSKEDKALKAKENTSAKNANSRVRR
ncbi:hypothetical protein [Pelobium manganitolerans]|nr:hypothetical protein [Pelobium manganitolerans]